MKETEQTLLDQIKDEVAEQYGQISWKYAMQNNGSHGISALWEYVCERYYQAKAKASCEATLIKASESAMVHYKGNLMSDPSDSSVLYHPDGSEFSINKQSILNPSNIVIL